MNRTLKQKISLLLFLFFSLGCFSQNDTIPPKPYYYYKGFKHGSQSLYNPLTLILNAGFDIYQLENHDRHLFKFPYAKSAGNVFWNLGHPGKVIGEIGWWEVISTEVIPTSVKPEKAQWVPNYLLHFVGGGMTYANMAEWYRFHNVKYPKVFSFFTVMAAHLMNETIENNGYKGSNSDPLPDIYIFNLGGIALFSSEKVNKFFSEKLHMADWSLQPTIALTDFTLQNNGQYFAFKWEIPFERRLSLFMRAGMGSLFGASWKFPNGTALSVGAGVQSGQRFLVSEVGRQVSITTPFSVGVFYDKDNSLLASVQVSNVSDNFVNANVYPGLLKIKGFSPGLWANFNKKGEPVFGITTRYTLGVGLGYDTRKP